MNCVECDRLWRAYALTTRQHIELIRSQEQAAHGDDIEKMKDLEGLVSAALEWHELARLQIKTHDAIHGEQPK